MRALVCSFALFLFCMPSTTSFFFFPSSSQSAYVASTWRIARRVQKKKKSAHVERKAYCAWTFELGGVCAFFFFFFFSFTLLHRLDAKPALIKSVFFSVVQKHKYGSPSLKQQEPLCTFRHENGRSNESANDKETKRKMKPSPALTHLSSSATKNEGKKSNCFFFFWCLNV